MVSVSLRSLLVASALTAALACSAVRAASSAVSFISLPLLPDAAAPGSPAFTLTVNGTGFVSGSTVLWNGHPRSTQFVSGSQLTASILASDVAKAGTASVTVKSPGSRSQVSNPAYFNVTSSTTSVSFMRSTTPSGFDPGGVTSGDFNGDGILDLAFAESHTLGALRLNVCLGRRDGTFQPCVGYATKPYPKSVLAADFNGDGNLDIVTTDGWDLGTPPAVSVLLGNGNGTFQPHKDSATAAGPFAIAAGDFNGDGRLDLAVTIRVAPQGNGSQVSVLLGRGDGTFDPHVEYQTGSAPDAIAVADFNGDGKLDLVTANYGLGPDGNISILLGNGDGSFQNPLEYSAGQGPLGVAVGDFNGDGALDLAVVNTLDSTVSVLLGEGDGTFQPAVQYTVPSNPVDIAAADFNADGKLDLAVIVGSTATVAILLGKGDGTFAAPSSSPPGGLVGPLTVGDFNGDGKLDVVAVDGAFLASVLLQTSSQ